MDGVYIYQPEDIFFSFNNIERVEVLKGPQGTLYGRNAVGGAINIITREPAQKPGIDASLGYGNYNTLEAKLYATTGITDKLAADIAAYKLAQFDGFGRNLVTGRPTNQTRDEGVRTKWVYEPSDETKITLSGDYIRRHSDVGALRHPVPGARLVSGSAGFVGPFDVQQDFKSDAYINQLGTSLRVEHNFDWARLVSISALHSSKALLLIDQDGGPLPFLSVRIQIPSTDYSEELQLLSPESSALKWILGAFYMHAYSEYKPESLVGLAEGGLHNTLNTYGNEGVQSRAVFGQATAPILPTYNLTIGLRYTSDLRTARGFNILPSGALQRGTLTDTSKTFNKLSWRFSLDHQFSDTVMGYISDNRGFKSGVYNMTAVAQPPARPETLDAYEIGVKTDWFEHRLRINTSGFYYDDRDIQLTRNFGTFTALYNAANGEIYGLDLDATVQPLQGLTLQAGLEALHAEYLSFPGAPATFPRLPAPGNATGAIDAKGKHMIHAPPYIFTIAGTYAVPLSFGTLTLTGSYAYNDGFYWEPDNRIRQPSYGLLDAGIAWSSPDDRYTLRLWGKNLTDQRYDIWISTSALGDQAATGAPMTYGATVEIKM